MKKNNQSILPSSIVLSSFCCLAMNANCSPSPIPTDPDGKSSTIQLEGIDSEQPKSEAGQDNNSTQEDRTLKRMFDTIQECIVQVKKVQSYLTDWKASHLTISLDRLDQTKPEDVENLNQLAQYLNRVLYMSLDGAESCATLASKVNSYLELASGAAGLEKEQIEQFAQEFNQLFTELKSIHEKVQQYVSAHPSLEKADSSSEVDVEAIKAAKRRVEELMDKIGKESEKVTNMYGEMYPGEEHYFSETKARMLKFETQLESLKEQYTLFNDSKGLKLLQIEEIENKLSDLLPVIQDIFTKILENFRTRNDERFKKSLEEQVAKVEQEATAIQNKVNLFIKDLDERRKQAGVVSITFDSFQRDFVSVRDALNQHLKCIQQHSYLDVEGSQLKRFNDAKEIAKKSVGDFVNEYMLGWSYLLANPCSPVYIAKKDGLFIKLDSCEKDWIQIKIGQRSRFEVPC